ncbi:hypothetical protein SB85_03335 [Xanthomonas sacchari]|nr:hypothetical protein SB85_03335 [Xanthomonas sacchari]
MRLRLRQARLRQPEAALGRDGQDLSIGSRVELQRICQRPAPHRAILQRKGMKLCGARIDRMHMAAQRQQAIDITRNA